LLLQGMRTACSMCTHYGRIYSGEIPISV
jgi:hypothetical protein